MSHCQRIAGVGEVQRRTCGTVVTAFAAAMKFWKLCPVPTSGALIALGGESGICTTGVFQSPYPTIPFMQ